MNKLGYLLSINILVLGLAGCQSPQKEPVEDVSHPKPNLIVIMLDDLGYQDVGFNGCKDIPTPGIDQIAQNGIKFTNAYTAFSVCSPSRAGFITGRYPQRFGYERNPLYRPEDPDMGLIQAETTIAESLSAADYTCGLIGKWHLGANPVHHPLKHGFDEFFGHLGGGHRYFPEELIYEDSYAINEESDSYKTLIMRNHDHVKTEKYLTDEFSEEAIAFIERNRSNPFFLFLSYNAPHAPLQAPDKYLARFDTIKDEKRKTYAAMVSAVDDGIGRMLSKLQELTLEENTMVVFLSDNGGPENKNASDNGALRAGKGSPYEGGFRVPFAIQWKGQFEPGVFNGTISSLDIFATIAALADAPLNSDRPLDGVNLTPYLKGEKQGNPHESIFLRDYDDKIFAVRNQNYKLVTHDNAAIKELYNLEKDIGETNDISDESTEILEKIDALRLRWNEELIRPTFLGLSHGGAWGVTPRAEEIYEVK